MKEAPLMTQRKCFSGPSNRQKAVFWLEAAGAFFRLFLRNRKFCFPQAAKRLPFAESARHLFLSRSFPGNALTVKLLRIRIKEKREPVQRFSLDSLRPPQAGGKTSMG